jgi:hypothetical protein
MLRNLIELSEDCFCLIRDFDKIIVQDVSKELYKCFPNITVWRVLRKYLHLQVYNLSSVQDVERWVVYTPVNVNVFVTLATQ